VCVTPQDLAAMYGMSWIGRTAATRTVSRWEVSFRVDSDSDTRRRRDDLFQRHVVPEISVLLRVAGRLTAQNADAEDLVQDTLIRAYKAVDRFDGQHPRAWLLTILRRTAINRSRGRHPDLLRDPEVGLDEIGPAGGHDSAEGVVLRDEFDAAVQQAVGELSDSQRDVVALVDVQGFGYAEASRSLGLPEGTVMSRLHRARARMRKRLAAAGVVPKRGE
jgi:RNA polymerase sigma-70 factor (ECF subfamily)